MEHDDDEAAKKLTCKLTIKTASTLNPKTGVTSKAMDKFSAEKWGLTTRRYVKSIHKMNDGSLEDITDQSMKFMSLFKSRQLVMAATPDTPDNDDIHACLVEGWHVLSRTAVFQNADISFFL
jgi:hypothetical protein